MKKINRIQIVLRDLLPLIRFKKREKHPWGVLLLVKLQAFSLQFCFANF